MTQLNGVNLPGLFGIANLLVRSVGSALVAAAGLSGVAEMMASIGASIAVQMVHLPIPKFDNFRDDTHKREFITTGIACGFTVAFGAPLAGTLFAHEISKPNSFWNIKTVLQSLLSSVIAMGTFCSVTFLQVFLYYKYENLPTDSYFYLT